MFVFIFSQTADCSTQNPIIAVPWISTHTNSSLLNVYIEIVHTKWPNIYRTFPPTTQIVCHKLSSDHESIYTNSIS
jgi:hypothetical protein